MFNNFKHKEQNQTLSSLNQNAMQLDPVLLHDIEV